MVIRSRWLQGDISLCSYPLSGSEVVEVIVRAIEAEGTNDIEEIYKKLKELNEA